jgi:hypothetical protein
MLLLHIISISLVTGSSCIDEIKNLKGLIEKKDAKTKNWVVIRRAGTLTPEDKCHSSLADYMNDTLDTVIK